MPPTPCFLYLAWMRRLVQDYVHAKTPATLKSRAIALSPRQFGAALLMAYLGNFSISGLAAAAGVALATLEEWRRDPKFLLVMDWSKSRFVKYFQETLVLEDFSGPEYEEIAGEFACLEESLRVRVRTGLYPNLKDLGDRLASQYRHGLPLETSNFPLFRRLFLFFWTLEAFWPSPARPRLREKLLPLAREVVWPTLGWGDGTEISEEVWRNPTLRVRLLEVLKRELAKVFHGLSSLS